MEAPSGQQSFLGSCNSLPSLPLPPLPLSVNQLVEASATKKRTRVQWLQDESQRRSTFKKRRSGIFKKAEELNILCDVETCVIVYGVGESEPAVWPDVETALRICTEFKNLPGLGRVRMMRSHTHFLREMVGKRAQQLWHQHDEVVDAEARCFLYDGLMGVDLRAVSRERLIKLHAKIREMLRERYDRCSVLRGRFAAGNA